MAIRRIWGLTPPRRVSSRELADLSTDWENPRVDTNKYYQISLNVWEVNRGEYDERKKDGVLCQIFKGRYYIGA